MSLKGKRILTGVVVSDKMQKSAIVKVETLKMHPKYQKQVKDTKKYAIHDEKDEAKIGDLVEIVESRPLSKTKKFALIKIIKRGQLEVAV
jgi:small subunit ribosomal protein S17